MKLSSMDGLVLLALSPNSSSACRGPPLSSAATADRAADTHAAAPAPAPDAASRYKFERTVYLLPQLDPWLSPHQRAFVAQRPHMMLEVSHVIFILMRMRMLKLTLIRT